MSRHMCNRCPGAANCLLNYNGTACNNWRAKNAPDVVFSKIDLLLEFSDKQLARVLSAVQMLDPKPIEFWEKFLTEPTTEYTSPEDLIK